MDMFTSYGHIKKPKENYTNFLVILPDCVALRYYIKTVFMI